MGNRQGKKKGVWKWAENLLVHHQAIGLPEAFTMGNPILSCSFTLSWFPNPDHLSFFILIYLEPYIYTHIYIYLPFIYHTPSNSPNSQCPTGTSKNHVVLSCCRPLISPLKPGNSRILKWRYFSTIFWAKLGAYPHRNFGPGKSALYMVGTSNFGWNGHWYYENASDRMIH
jgi:hypothetical protein